jgi:hypothetical protein
VVPGSIRGTGSVERHVGQEVILPRLHSQCRDALRLTTLPNDAYPARNDVLTAGTVFWHDAVQSGRF